MRKGQKFPDHLKAVISEKMKGHPVSRMTRIRQAGAKRKLYPVPPEWAKEYHHLIRVKKLTYKEAMEILRKHHVPDQAP